MKKIVLSALAALTIGTLGASAGDVKFYTDDNGQVFTTAGEGRTEIKSKSTSVFAKASKLKFSGTHYLGYTHKSYKQKFGSTATTGDDSKHTEGNFELRRNYLQVKAYLLEDPKSYLRVTLDTVYSSAKDKIKDNQKKAIYQAIEKIAKGYKEVVPIKVRSIDVYKLIDEKERIMGYAFLVEGQGYQDKIKILGVINKSGTTLKGIEIIDSKETPGLGARIGEEFFTSQFKNLKVFPSIQLIQKEKVKNNQVKAITGATVSSTAVVNILNKGIKELREAGVFND